MTLFVMMIIAGIINYFIGYYIGVRRGRTGILKKDVESIVESKVEPIVEGTVENPTDLSFDNFKESNEYDSDFTIEHYPESRKFYPKYKDLYLKTKYSTGIVQTENEMYYAQSTTDEIGALRLIELYKEQKFKKNVATIKVKKT